MTNKAALYSCEDSIVKNGGFLLPRATEIAGGWDQGSLKGPLAAHCSSCQLLGKGLGLGLATQDLLDFCTKDKPIKVLKDLCVAGPSPRGPQLAHNLPILFPVPPLSQHSLF